jgi:plastocyanin
MKRFRLTAGLAALTAAGALLFTAQAQYGSGGGAKHTATHTTAPMAINAKQGDFQDAMRKLWEDHVVWTRLFIVSAVANLPDKAATTERLLQNQTDIGNAIKPYYGNDAGNKLTALLKDHILIAADVVTFAKANDKTRLDSANKRWFANADDISRFLSDANPNWKYDHVRDHMRDHLNLTTEEAVAQIKGDWRASIRAYDKVHEQILHMADMLTDGIVAQFPSKFGSTASTKYTNYVGGVMDIRAENYRFYPDTIRVWPGQEVRIRLHNEAMHEHNIVFSINGVEYTLPRDLRRNRSGEVRFKAPMKPGRYEFWCPIGDHARRGMRGTLIVE